MTEEMETWLGPATAGMTDEQLVQVRAAAREIADRWPDEDQREAALTATVRWMAGDLTTDRVAARLAQCRLAAQRPVRAAHLAYVAALQVAMLEVDAGAEKKATAAAVGIDRAGLTRAMRDR